MKKLYGAALIEMLVSVFVFSIFLFAITHQSLLSIYYLMRSSDGAIASEQIQNLESYLQVYSETHLDTVKLIWKADVKTVLPNAKSFIHGQYPSLLAQIIWDKSTSQCNQINNRKTCLQQKIYIEKKALA